MFKQRIVIVTAVGALAAGVGVASAFADEQPAVTTGPTTALLTSDDELADEQGAANDVAAAANDVQDEAGNTGADDESGDEQGSDDQGAAGDVADAANDVQDEAENVDADDQQGPDDQSGEQDDEDQDG